MEKKTIGAFIAALRKANGLTQKQLAEKLNVSDKAVSRWERDEAMPDLTLIPVIAEIFNVTSDEILRGQRSNPETAGPVSTERTTRQLERVLKDTRSKYQIRSTITLGIAIVGIIAAMICNFGFLRAYIGFGVASIFYLAAAICQVIFTISAFSALDSDEYDIQQTITTRTAIVNMAMLTFSAVVTLFAATLPLMTLAWDAYIGLTGDTWAMYGALYALVGALVCYILTTILSKQFMDRGVILGALQKVRLRVLRIRYIATAIVCYFLIGLTVLHCATNFFTFRDFTEGTTFTTWEDFKEHMETPVYYDGIPISDGTMLAPVPDPDGYEESMEQYKQVLTDHENNIICEYYHLNMPVSYNIYHGSQESGYLPVTVYTYDQINQGYNTLQNIRNAVMFTFMAAWGIALYLFYRRAKKKIG